MDVHCKPCLDPTRVAGEPIPYAHPGPDGRYHIVASPGERLLGYLVDEAIIDVPVLLGGWLLLGIVVPEQRVVPIKLFALALVLARAIYHAAFIAAIGRTPGKAMLGMTVVDDRGKIPSRSQAIKRAFIAEFFRLFRTCLLGLFDPASIYESRERRTWHDSSANTWVIRHGTRVGSLHSTAALIIGLFAFFTPIVLSAQYDVQNPLDPLILEVMPAVDDAMSPTIRRGDFLLVSSRLYSQREYRPQRGDIAEIAPPRRVQHAGRSLLRIIALPGDRVAIVDGALYRNGQRVPEPYLSAPRPYSFPGDHRRMLLPDGDVQRLTDGWLTVPPGHLFALGDNPEAMDSHTWTARRRPGEVLPCPYAPAHAAGPRASAIVWPPSRIRSLE